MWAGRLIVLGVTLAACGWGAPPSGAGKRPESVPAVPTNGASAPGHGPADVAHASVLDRIQAIPSILPFTATTVEGVLGTGTSRACDSCPEYRVRSPVSEFAAVTLVEHRWGGRLSIELDPQTCITYGEVNSRFGDLYPVSPFLVSSPHATAVPDMFWREVPQEWGVYRFAFDKVKGCLVVIVLDTAEGTDLEELMQTEAQRAHE